VLGAWVVIAISYRPRVVFAAASSSPALRQNFGRQKPTFDAGFQDSEHRTELLTGFDRKPSAFMG
jgi:hypothetical protein